MCSTATLKMYKAKVGQGVWRHCGLDGCKSSGTCPLIAVPEPCEQVACPRSKLGQGEAWIAWLLLFYFPPCRLWKNTMILFIQETKAALTARLVPWMRKKRHIFELFLWNTHALALSFLNIIKESWENSERNVFWAFLVYLQCVFVSFQNS